MWAAVNPRVASVRTGDDTAGPARGGACGWKVSSWGAMSCRRAVVGQRRGLARTGLVQIGLAGGHLEMVRFAVGGLAGCDVVTELSQVVRNMVGRSEIR